MDAERAHVSTPHRSPVTSIVECRFGERMRVFAVRIRSRSGRWLQLCCSLTLEGAERTHDEFMLCVFGDRARRFLIHDEADYEHLPKMSPEMYVNITKREHEHMLIEGFIRASTAAARRACDACVAPLGADLPLQDLEGMLAVEPTTPKVPDLGSVSFDEA